MTQPSLDPNALNIKAQLFKRANSTIQKPLSNVLCYPEDTMYPVDRVIHPSINRGLAIRQKGEKFVMEQVSKEGRIFIPR